MRGSPDKELKRLVFFSLSIWVCSLTCPEGWHVFHSSSWHAALVHPGRGSRAGAGRGCPVVSAPPGWMPCPAGWRGSGYTTLPSPKEFIQGEVHKLNKKSENPDHSDSCVRHHSLRLAMTHARAQVQWSIWSFLTELVALNVSEPWWRNPKEGNTEKFLDVSVTWSWDQTFILIISPCTPLPSGYDYFHCCSVSKLAGIPKSDRRGVWGLIYLFCPIVWEPELTPLAARLLFPHVCFSALYVSLWFVHGRGNTDLNGE